MQTLTTALAGSAPPGEEACWNDLLAALDSVISSPLTSEAEQLLLEILRFDGELRLEESSEMPHSMSREDMLKSLAVQALARWSGPTYVLPMQRVLATTSSPALASVVRAVIQRLGQPENQVQHQEEGVESSPEDLDNWRLRPVIHDRGSTFCPDKPAD
jgi:hypothetical protein